MSPIAWAEEIPDRSPRGIAAAIGRLISDGRLPAGQRLPTVRGLARDLSVSPATVAAAWSELVAAGALVTRGKGGTFVRAQASADGDGTRFALLGGGPETVGLDLSRGTPDPKLLPDLEGALSRVSRYAATTSYFDPPVMPELHAILQDEWPYKAEAITVVDGALDALDRVIAAIVRFGDVVLVEDPTFPPILDLLETAGAVIEGIPTDDHGIVPDLLAAAVAAHAPVLVVLQPRAHNPRGSTMTVKRTRAVAAALRSTSAWVLEDDHAGYITPGRPVSVGEFLPARTLTIRSFSKSHGPDLRLAALGGTGEIVERVARRRMLGPGWSSRHLQAVLAHRLTPDATARRLAEATEIYSARRAQLVTALRERNVGVEGLDGINLWIPVPHEQQALLGLAVCGIRVAAGSPFIVAGPDHIRVTCAEVSDNAEFVADTIAAAVARPLRRVR